MNFSSEYTRSSFPHCCKSKQLLIFTRKFWETNAITKADRLGRNMIHITSGIIKCHISPLAYHSRRSTILSFWPPLCHSQPTHSVRQMRIMTRTEPRAIYAFETLWKRDDIPKGKNKNNKEGCSNVDDWKSPPETCYVSDNVRGVEWNLPNSRNDTSNIEKQTTKNNLEGVY